MRRLAEIWLTLVWNVTVVLNVTADPPPLIFAPYGVPLTAITAFAVGGNLLSSTDSTIVVRVFTSTSFFIVSSMSFPFVMISMVLSL